MISMFTRTRDRMDVTYTTTSTYLTDGSVTTDTLPMPTQIYVDLWDQSITEQGVIKAGTLAECWAGGSWNDQMCIALERYGANAAIRSGYDQAIENLAGG